MLTPVTGQTEALQKGRDFFDSFAKTYNFDPLIAENWYFISALQIRDFPVSTATALSISTFQ
jgi:hypothetical protein